MQDDPIKAALVAARNALLLAMRHWHKDSPEPCTTEDVAEVIAAYHERLELLARRAGRVEDAVEHEHQAAAVDRAAREAGDDP